MEGEWVEGRVGEARPPLAGSEDAIILDLSKEIQVIIYTKLNVAYHNGPFLIIREVRNSLN